MSVVICAASAVIATASKAFSKVSRLLNTGPDTFILET